MGVEGADVVEVDGVVFDGGVLGVDGDPPDAGAGVTDGVSAEEESVVGVDGEPPDGGVCAAGDPADEESVVVAELPDDCVGAPPPEPPLSVAQFTYTCQVGPCMAIQKKVSLLAPAHLLFS